MFRRNTLLGFCWFLKNASLTRDIGIFHSSIKHRCSGESYFLGGCFVTYRCIGGGRIPLSMLTEIALFLPWSVQANCTSVAAARLMSKLLTMNSGCRSWYREILLPYGMPDKQYQREALYIYITHQKCNTYMTSKVRGIFRPTQQSMIT